MHRHQRVRFPRGVPRKHVGHTAANTPDFTEQLFAEDRNRAEQYRAFLATIVDSSDEAIIGEAFDGTIISWNRGAEQIFGYTASEALGLNIGILFPPELRDELPEMLAHVRRGDVLIEHKSQRITKDGRRIDTSSSAFPIFDSSKRVIQAGSICRDITQFSMMEELRLARDAAEIASRAKSEYLSRMSHELRTPLNAILGFAQLMQMRKQSAQNAESIDVILKCGLHLLNLINDVLDIARIEAGKLGLSLEPVSVEEMLLESCDVITPLAAQKDISIHIDSPGAHDTMVLADRQRLKQILLNYLSNALKYNNPGVAVSVGYERRPDAWVRLVVQDAGVGIPPEKIPLLFSPFERLGAERTGVEGTGLGLAIAKQLAEAMNGKVGVESVVGQGSAFWVELPETTISRMVGPEQSDSIRVNTPDAAEQKIFRLLYIEDNPLSVRLIEQIVAQRPRVRLLTAHSGLGYELAEQHLVDLVLLDLNLPDLSGDEVLRMLLGNPLTRSIPVVIMSADASPSTIQRLKQAGAYDFLPKPINVKSFLELLDGFLDQGK